MTQSDSSWRYHSPEAAKNYAARTSRRMQREARLLQRLLAGETPLGDLLDVPCGTGRLAPLLLERGAKYHGCDAAEGMLRESADRGVQLVQGRLPRLPLADRSFETVVCFRFLHHVPWDQQAEVVQELARIAKHRLVLTGFHPCSTHELQRQIRLRFSGRARGRFPTKPSKIAEALNAAGFRVERIVREGWLRDLWLGSYVRT